MRLGVFTVLLSDLPFEAALDKLAAMDVEAVEVGTGNYPGAAHCDADALLADRAAARRFRAAVEERGMIVSALSQHGNPLHPNAEVADAAHRVWERTVELASDLEVPVVNAFAGCPGDGPAATRPNWVTCAWPDDYLEVLAWQWDERVVPYWREQAAFAARHGIRVAMEMHPGFVVYNTETMLRLRAATGENVGANFDPSHLWWQGMDPLESIRALGRAGAIFHVHAKDVEIDRGNTARNGVLDTTPYARIGDRSWTFRTVGYGHGEETWRQILSALRVAGYDYAVSIEHEDALLSVDEGLGRAVALLSDMMPREAATAMWWA